MNEWLRILAVPLLAAAACVGWAQEGRLGAAAESAEVGRTVWVQGRVLDTGGRPLQDAVVELWQADRNGNYDHPADSRPGVLLEDFQYYGTSTTDGDGLYAFLTVKPSPYGRRPAHLHLKVKVDGRTALVSQFYFEEDRRTVEGDAVFRNAGPSLFLRPAGTTVLEDREVRVLVGDIVLDLAGGGGPGRLEPTPRQAEGPYYPVVDFSGYDNDLTRRGPGGEPVGPLPPAALR